MSGVLVTGASGWLGAAVARDLIAAGHRVRTLQRRPSGIDGAEDVLGSVTDPNAIDRALAGVDSVVHLAAKVSFAGAEAEFVAVNIDGTRRLVRAAKRAGVHRFVFVSSPSVAHTGEAIMGEDAVPAQPEQARGAYARTKAAAEIVALGADAPGFAVVAVRPHIVWGPGDPQLVARIQERAAAGRLPLVGSGAALIDSTYIDDAVSGIRAALDAAERVHGNAYVLTSGEPRPIAELIAGFCVAAGIAPPSRHLPAAAARAAGSVVEAFWRVRPGEDEPPMTRFLAEQLSTAHWFDQRRTRRDLEWSPAVGVTEGLRRLASHHAAHGDGCHPRRLRRATPAGRGATTAGPGASASEPRNQPSRVLAAPRGTEPGRVAPSILKGFSSSALGASDKNPFKTNPARFGDAGSLRVWQNVQSGPRASTL